MAKVLVTGGTGFIGKALSSSLLQQDFLVTRTARHPRDGIISMPLNTSDWTSVLAGTDVVIHCAALADVSGLNRLEVYDLNVAAVRTLAKQAREQGIKRFIFLSSVKVLGEGTVKDEAYTTKSQYSPTDLYGESKRDAEIALRDVFSGSQTDLVIIRPPLVYGPGVKGNFRSLMKIAKRNFPLPLKSINNKRSLVALDNLMDLIITCVKHSEPLNDTFLISDDHDVSTKELLESLIKAYGKKPKLLPFPVLIMRAAAGLLGKKSVSERLLGNLQLDISYTKSRLNWKPKVSFHRAIRECVQADQQSFIKDTGESIK